MNTGNNDMFAAFPLPLDGDPTPAESATDNIRIANAAAEWTQDLYLGEQMRVRRYFFNNIDPTGYTKFADSQGTILRALRASYQFQDVKWAYGPGSWQWIHSHIGLRGRFAGNSPPAIYPRAFTMQLVPVMWSGNSTLHFANNSGDNPVFIADRAGGELGVVPNDGRGHLGNNRGGFDVIVTVLRPL